MKSPVASLCFVCSSFKYLVSVTISMLMLSLPTAPPSPSASPFIFATTLSSWLRSVNNVKIEVKCQNKLRDSRVSVLRKLSFGSVKMISEVE